MKLKIIAFFATIVMLFPLTSFAAETAKGKTIRLESYSGTVYVISGSGKEISVSEKMRVFDGYSVKTSSDSEAYLSLDDTKAIKLGENTEIIIKKSWFTNKVMVVCGEMFFNVTKPLEDNESLDISTSTMSMGIRGTSGAVIVKELENNIQLYTGKVEVVGKGKKLILTPGMQVTSNEELTASELSEKGQDIPSMALREIINDTELKEEISQKTNLDVENFINQEKINSNLEKEEGLKKSQEIEEARDEAQKERAENKKTNTEGRDVTGKSSGSGSSKPQKSALTLEVLHKWGSNSEDISVALDEFVTYAENYSSKLNIEGYKNLSNMINDEELHGVKGVIAENVFYYAYNPVYEIDEFKLHFLGYGSIDLFVDVFNEAVSNVEFVPDVGV